MKKVITTLALTALVLGSLALGSPARAAAPALYEITDHDPIYQKESAAISGVVDEVEIALDTGSLDQNPRILDLELPDGRRLTVARSRFDVEPGYLTWVGEVTAGDDGSRGYVHLVDHGDRVSGILNVGTERYQIVATELMGHRLVRIGAGAATCPFEGSDLEGSETRREPGEHRARGIEPIDGPVFEEAAPRSLGTPPATTAKATTTIDVLAVYPNAFSGSAETSLRNFIQTSVSLANDVFVRSNVNARYRLVEMARLSGAQPTETSVGASWLWINDEPSEVRALRDDYAADMVALFVPLSYDDDPSPICGIANLPLANGNIRSGGQFGSVSGPFGQRAFTVHRSGCGLNDFTFAHELGHNFGLRHDANESTSTAHLFPTARGHLLGLHPWQDNANGSLETDVPGDFAVGYHFTPQVDGFVTELGGLFNGTKRLKLFNKATGQLLAETTVSAFNTWSYRAIPAVPVDAGTTYTVAVYLAGTGGSIYSNVAVFPRTWGNVRIEGTTAVSTLNNPNARPTNTDTTLMYGQADIRFVRWATVMGCVGYQAGDDITGAVCNRIPHFSDPNISYQGLVTGTSDRNNAAAARVQVGPYSLFRTNNAPVCQDDFLTTPRDTRLSIPLGLLLGNDTDPDGDAVRLQDYDRTTARGGSNDAGHVGGFNYTPPLGFTGTDWFSYTVTDRAHSGGLTDTCTVFVDVTPIEEDFGEVGKVTDLTHAPRTVLLSRSYANPVVIAQTPSYNGSNPSVVRITSVQSDRFTFYIDEAPDMDGSHTTETVSYLVVEAGSWQLADGTELRAGRLQTSKTVGTLIANSWATVSYGGGFPAAPAVFSQVQTNNDPSWVKTRHTSVGTSSFLLGLEKEESSIGSHGSETVGWIAIEPAVGTWTSHPFRAGRTPNAVTNAWYFLSFSGTFSTPHFFAAMATYDGGDSAHLRYRSLGAGSVEVLVEEDTTHDTEMGHTSEVVDYLVLGGAGTLRGAPQ